MDYGKIILIDKKYNNFFLWKHKEIVNFLEQCIIIKKEINPINYDDI